jgi:hypothetical protein
MNRKPAEYIHEELNREIHAIGGYYRFTHEIRAPFEAKEILYLKGYALWDNTCCGAGGCSYVLVQGFVEQWKVRTNTRGIPVTRVNKIRDSVFQQRIRSFILKRETVQQVQFA